MDDEDQFEYDDDFDYDVESGSEGENENIRQEIELDDIKNMLKYNSVEATRKLEELAMCYTSSVCVEAALQLFKVRIGSESFLMLARSIANAPDSVEDFARCSAFEDATRLLNQSSDLSKHQFVDTCVLAVSILRKIRSSRVYLRAVLKLSDSYLSIGKLDEAWCVLDDDLEPALSLMNELSAPPFRFEAIILKIRLCMAANPVRRSELCHLVELASRIHHGAHSVSGMNVLQQTQGLLKLEAGLLDEAKMLLTECFRGQSESDLIEQDMKDDGTSVCFILILVLTVLGEGHFNPLLELPLIADVSADDQRLNLPIAIASSFRNRDVTAFVELLNQLHQKFSEAQWRLGQFEILHELKPRFVSMQLKYILQAYSRIKWDTLMELMGSQLEMNDSDFRCLVLDNELPGVFKRNTIDNTVDRFPANAFDWRSSATHSPSTIPLPKRYVEHANREMQKTREDKILSKWKATSQIRHVLPTKLRSENTGSTEAVYSLLVNAMNRHFEAMSE